MKLKAYNIAAMAILCLTIIGAKVFAQQATPPTPPVASAPAQSYSLPTPAIAGLGSINGQTYNLAPLAGINGYYIDGLGTQDTIYNKKMQKLQQQMRDLQKEMSGLRSEEMKKNYADIQKRNQDRYAQAFKGFDEKFKNMGQNMRFNFDNKEELDKKVASGDYKLKSKTYTKSYNVDKDDKLQIDNRYGRVTVVTWAKNEVKVDVDIRAYANEDDGAQKLLDQVKITDNKDNAGVTFKTVIGGDEEHKNNFWSTWTTNGKSSIYKTIINYTVYMPAKNALTINNSYGAVILPDLSGKVMIKNSYGALTGKALSNSNNAIDVKYGAADIESLNGGDVNVSYGSLNLLSADNLNATISYSPAKIGKLSTAGTINLHYGGGLQIGDLDKNLKTLSVTSSYAPIKLNSVTNNNADFDVTVHYAGFSYNNGVNVTSKSPSDDDRHWSSTQTYKGHIGKGSSDKVITIKSNYGSVKFDQ